MLEYLVQQKNAPGLREGAVEKASSQRIPTTSLVDESGVYGRDGDKEAIMKLQSNGKSRPVFQGSNGGPLFVMHDLVNDLARYVSREFCFRLEGEDSNKISERTRHLSYAVTRHDACERFEGIYDAKLLRTFLPLSEAWLRNQINVLPVSRVWPRNEIDNC
ncbi:hypothetical protein DKX38_006888 [Salix brachista]|uniref:Uncharacterized protein n=1 Tax=Salix brachista TaxID=2182728 RepID=A0A5N5MLP0_9ROSI|nr:hypothetical protein DKX38_006888 [Salix brachista]